MAGAYHDRAPLIPGQVFGAAVFRPPLSPSGSSYNLAKSTGSLYSDVSMSSTPAVNTKRKRGRTGGLMPVEWDLNTDTEQNVRGDERIAEMQYTLAGQIDTPGGAPSHARGGILEESVYSDIDYRRALGPERLLDDTEPASPRLSSLYPDSTSSDRSKPTGWKTFALNAIGGVVGRVWDFCTAGAFRGFQAGGGQGYGTDGASVTVSQDGRPWCNEHDLPTLQIEDGPYKRDVPGEFPQSDFMPYIVDHHKMSTPDTTPRPAVKRRQIGEHDGLRRNWVMVDEQQNLGSARKMPARARARHSSGFVHSTTSSNRRTSVPLPGVGGRSPGLNRRTSLRVSHAGSPRLSAREPASFAQPRSPIYSSPSSRIPLPSQLAQTQGIRSRTVAPTSLAWRSSGRQSRIPSPAPSMTGHARSNSHVHANPHTDLHTNSQRWSNGIASVASIVRGSGGVVLDADDISASPRLDAEAKQLAQRKLAAEHEADVRVDAFNARLREMIRQGKEALGTRVEVYGDGDGGGGGGWEDEDKNEDEDEDEDEDEGEDD